MKENDLLVDSLDNVLDFNENIIQGRIAVEENIIDVIETKKKDQKIIKIEKEKKLNEEKRKLDKERKREKRLAFFITIGKFIKTIINPDSYVYVIQIFENFIKKL